MSKPTNFSYSNNLISTKQPIVVVKGETTNMPASSSGVVGGLSRPNVNLGNSPKTSPETNYNNAVNFTGPFRKAYPIKHWRRQLQVNGKSGRSATSISVVDRPGGTVFRGYNSDIFGCACSIDGNNLFITFDNKYLQSPYKSIKPPANVSISSDTINNKIQNNGSVVVGDVNNGGYEIQTGVYNTKTLCCSEAKKSRDKTRTMTSLSKSYYSDTKGYLKARCNLFQQKQSIQQIPSNNYSSETGNPYNSSTQFTTNNCYQTGKTDCQNVTYYNPNNVQFAKQGAVDSSTRLAKLNYDTITKNGASFNSAKGLQYATAGKYHGQAFTPYFVKNKSTPSLTWKRNGSKELCNKNCASGQSLGGFWGSSVN